LGVKGVDFSSNGQTGEIRVNANHVHLRDFYLHPLAPMRDFRKFERP